MFRNLIPVVSRSFPSHGAGSSRLRFSQSPPRARFAYTFDNLAKVIESFTEVIGLTYYAIYVFERVRVGDVAGFTAKIVQDVLHRHGDGAAKRFCGLPCHTRCQNRAARRALDRSSD